MIKLYYFTAASGKQSVNVFLQEQGKKEREKIVEVFTYFREHGFHLPTKYLRRMSGTKRLWELRAKYQSKQYRVFIAAMEDNGAVLLHAIVKKTQKTPPSDIEIAEHRLRLLEQT